MPEMDGILDRKVHCDDDREHRRYVDREERAPEEGPAAHRLVGERRDPDGYQVDEKDRQCDEGQLPLRIDSAAPAIEAHRRPLSPVQRSGFCRSFEPTSR